MSPDCTLLVGVLVFILKGLLGGRRREKKQPRSHANQSKRINSSGLAPGAQMHMAASSNLHAAETLAPADVRELFSALCCSAPLVRVHLICISQANLCARMLTALVLLPPSPPPNLPRPAVPRRKRPRAARPQPLRRGPETRSGRR